MNNIIFIGARGMGRSLHNYLKDFNEYNIEFTIKGFLDDNPNALDEYSGYAPIIGTVYNYSPSNNDLFVSTLGDISVKKEYTQPIIEKGGNFFTFIHPLAKVMFDAQIGYGAIIGPWASIGSAAKIGNHCLIQSYAVIGHDVNIGDWSRVDTNVVCSGGAKIGSCVTIHTSAIINQKAIIEDNAKIGAGSFVLKSVKQGKTVYGNPAREL